MVHCPSCGSANEDAAQFCLSCGQSLAEHSDTVGPAPIPSPRRQRRPGRTVLFALLVVAVVGAMAGGVDFLAPGKSEGWIAFQAESDGLWALGFVRPDGEEPPLWVMRSSAFGYALVQRGEHQGKVTPFAPNGERMLFVAQDGEGWSLYTYAIGKEKVEKLLHSAQNPGFSYSPDGDRIAVRMQDYDGEGSLLVMDVDGESIVPLLNRVEGEFSWKWLPKGRRLIVTLRDQGEWSLLLMDDQGEEQVTVVDKVEGVEHTVSSNGDWIAYAVKEDSEWDVYVADADGSAPTQVEGRFADVTLLDLSPDGKRLLVDAGSDGGGRDLLLIETDGSDQVVLARHMAEVGGGFCLDGKRIWYGEAQGETGSLYLADADGSDWTLIERQIEDLNWEFTPDGRMMIVGLEKEGDYALYAVKVATGELVELISGVDYLGPLVSIDDKRVLFSAKDEGDWSLYIARLNGRKLFELDGTDWGFLGYDASPNGRRVVYSEEGFSSPLIPDLPHSLRVIDADGDNRETLCSGCIAPVWSD